MKQNNKIPKQNFLIISSMLFFFGLFKAINILNIPLFWDEAVFLNISTNFINKPSLLFNSFNLFPYPIMVWILSLLLFINKLFQINPLLIGRLMILICDLIAAVYIYKIGKTLFNNTAGLISIFIYFSLPLTYLHSRLLLLEAMTNMFVLILMHSVILFTLNFKDRKKRRRQLFSIFIGTIIAYLTKPTSLTVIPALLLIPFFLQNKNKLSIFLLTGLSLLTAELIIYFISRQVIVYYPGFIMNGNYNLSYALDNFKSNIWKSLWWSNAYLTKPVIIVFIIGAICGLVSRSKKVIWLSVWPISVVLLSSFFSIYYFPRHIQLIASPVALLCAWIITRISSNNLRIFTILCILLFSFPIYKDIRILANPVKADLALEDHQQYFHDWTSGRGLKEIAQQLKNNSINKENIVFTGDDYLLGWGLSNLYDIGNFKINNNPIILDNGKIDKQKYFYNCTTLNCYVVINHVNFNSNQQFLKLYYTFSDGERNPIRIYKYE